jgi:nicotinamidase-related amidase
LGLEDALVVIDVINDFRHEDGDALLVSFRDRHSGLLDTLGRARDAQIPVIYANDNWGRWDSDAPGLVRQAVEHGRAGELVAAVQPRPGDRFVLKPRYSAFDATPLDLLLRDLAVERILLAGMATEMCVAQTAIAGRELGFKVTVLAAACACVDQTDERIALEYLERVVGAWVDETWPRSAAGPSSVGATGTGKEASGGANG